jgi:hypothetical protein
MKPGNDLRVAGLRLSAGCESVCVLVCELRREPLRAHLLTRSRPRVGV